MRTTETKIKELEQEIALTKKYLLPLEELGIEGSLISNSWISTQVENLSEIHKITKLFPPSEKMGEIGFAGKDSIISNSPYTFHVSNYSHSEATSVTVKYESTSLPIWIKIPFRLLPSRKEEVTKQVRRDGGSHTVVIGNNHYIPMGKVQKYAGGGDYAFGSRVSYAVSDADAKDFKYLMEGE